MHAYRTLAIAGAGAIALAAAVAGAANAESLPFVAPTVSPSVSTSLVTISASPSGTSTTSTSPAVSPSPTSEVITADIHVELGFPEDDGPMVFEAFDVPVGDGPEMINPTPVSNPSEYCGDAYVDISLDPTTITLGGGEEYCNFAEAYFEITLHGTEFASVTLTSDSLFEGPEVVGLGGSGGLFKSRALHLGPSDPSPVLDSYGASGSRFAAWWSGASGSGMSGTAGFTWAPVARAAGGAGGSPAFTG